MAKIHYARTDEFWRKAEKYAFLEEQRHVGQIDWRPITPDKRQIWLTEGLQDEFEHFIPIASKDRRTNNLNQISTLFENYSTGIYTGRDSWVYGFDQAAILMRIRQSIEFYNAQVVQWQQLKSKTANANEYIDYNDTKIKWSRNLIRHFERGRSIIFRESAIKQSSYRPFHKRWLYFDEMLVDEDGSQASFFPNENSTLTNRVIWLKVGSAWPMFALMVNTISDYMPQGGSQCFPFYTYSEDGSNRRENITDWALTHFQHHYTADDQSKIQNPKPKIEKWHIFHYLYALLHHPDYRAKYAANLRRELPRIPLVEDFWGFAQAGARLADLHVHYERQAEYPLTWIENADQPLNWRVARMKLSRDKSSLVYNDFHTLAGIPPQVYEYKLGNRSALEWVIDQYQVSVDKRSAIVNDPNQPDDPQAILRLIGQVITVSLATVEIVNSLPPLTIKEVATA